MGRKRCERENRSAFLYRIFRQVSRYRTLPTLQTRAQLVLTAFTMTRPRRAAGLSIRRGRTLRHTQAGTAVGSAGHCARASITPLLKQRDLPARPTRSVHKPASRRKIKIKASQIKARPIRSTLRHRFVLPVISTASAASHFRIWILFKKCRTTKLSTIQHSTARPELR